MADQFIAGNMVHGRAIEMADEAYNCGQPFMDGLMSALLVRGAQPPTDMADIHRKQAERRRELKGPSEEDAFTFAEGVAKHYRELRRNLVPEAAAERLTLDYQRMMLGIVTDD